MKNQSPDEQEGLQLDLPGIIELAYTDIFTVSARFQNLDQFWISHQKNQGSFFIFFEKSKKRACTAEMIFLVILTKKMMVL